MSRYRIIYIPTGDFKDITDMQIFRNTDIDERNRELFYRLRYAACRAYVGCPDTDGACSGCPWDRLFGDHNELEYIIEEIND